MSLANSCFSVKAVLAYSIYWHARVCVLSLQSLLDWTAYRLRNLSDLPVVNVKAAQYVHTLNDLLCDLPSVVLRKQ